MQLCLVSNLWLLPWVVLSFQVDYISTIRNRNTLLVKANTHDDVASFSSSPLIALTREEGKNGKLQQALSSFATVELPCIAHADGPDLNSLPEKLRDESWDYVVVTSPEAAKVLAQAWSTIPSDCPPPPVVAVGKATQETLERYGIQVCFTPSKATAATLVVELPFQAPCRVLYPASCKAKTTLQDGLKQRGFDVVRMNTYDTVTASWSDEDKERAKQCRLACFASPSSVNGWLKNTNNNQAVLAVCIGETSARACREKGWSEERIFFPDKPGLEGWVAAVHDATNQLQLNEA
jgi:uroporphyrinogen-III synthase